MKTTKSGFLATLGMTMRNIAKTTNRRAWIGAAVCVAITGAVGRFYEPAHSLDEKAVADAQDEVYAAVVRNMTSPDHRETQITQLVFGEALLINEGAGVGYGGCEKEVRGRLPLASDPLPFNSWFDKAYRFVTRGWGDQQVEAEVMEDYAQKLCIPGHLSRTFHTDLPRTFISRDSVHFEGWPVEKNGPPPFEKRFPGAVGIISFSRVGFDCAFDEAIVSTSFVCGGLCGSGWRHFLKKRRGRWQITDATQVWVS